MISELLPCDACECEIVSLIQDSFEFGNRLRNKIGVSCFHCGHSISVSEPIWHDFKWDKEKIEQEKRLLIDRWNVRISPCTVNKVKVNE